MAYIWRNCSRNFPSGKKGRVTRVYGEERKELKENKKVGKDSNRFRGFDTNPCCDSLPPDRARERVAAWGLISNYYHELLHHEYFFILIVRNGFIEIQFPYINTHIECAIFKTKVDKSSLARVTNFRKLVHTNINVEQ